MRLGWGGDDPPPTGTGGDRDVQSRPLGVCKIYVSAAGARASVISHEAGGDRTRERLGRGAWGPLVGGCKACLEVHRESLLQTCALSFEDPGGSPHEKERHS